jgi:hypothetical protein
MTQQLQMIPSQDCGTQVRELPSDELDKAVGGLLSAVSVFVCPSDPSAAGGGVWYLRNSNTAGV